MIYPHAIRLAGPWDYEVIRADAGAATHSPTGRVRLPADWGGSLGHTFRGLVRYRRRFNRPTNLDAQECVWLVIEGVDSRGRAYLNGHPLGDVGGSAQPAEFDVTTQLMAHNELSIDVECPAADNGVSIPRPGREELPGGIIGPVRLEIRRSLSVQSSVE